MLNKSNRYLLGERFVFSPSDSSLIDLHESDDLVRLGSNECRVLMVLIEEPHAIVTRNRIHDFVWRKQGFEVDDSSLTQSISTLRKALKDSIKNPMFVKTVPKRGYQVVCSVEVYNDQDVELPKPVAPIVEPTIAAVEPTESTVHADSVTPEAVPEVIPTAAPVSEPSPAPFKTPLSSWAALVLALLIPLLFQISATPKSQAFSEILKVENIPVYIPVGNARITQWQPLVNRCVDKYLNYYEGERSLKEVIVTGGQDNRISLNYIHNAQDSDHDVTYVLLTSQEGSEALCR